MMLRKVVVLPAPLRPTRQTSSPAATFRLMPLRIRLPSISTFRFDKLSMGMLSKSGPRSHDGSDHGGVGEEGIGRHVGEKGAGLQRDDAMGIPLDEVHIVLDLDDRAHAHRLGG